MHMECFLVNLFYEIFIYTSSHDLIYPIKIEKEMGTEAAASIFLVDFT